MGAESLRFKFYRWLYLHCIAQMIEMGFGPLWMIAQIQTYTTEKDCNPINNED